MQEQLRNVQQIQANDMSFVACRDDGYAIFWGGVDNDEPLANVRRVQSSNTAYLLLRDDNSPVLRC